MAEAGLQTGYVVIGLIEQLRAKGVLDGDDLRSAAGILEKFSADQPNRSPEKSEAIQAAIATLLGLAG